MTTTMYLLNLGLLAFVLWANLGTRTVTRSRLALPVLLVIAAGAVFLRDVPTAGHDVALEAAGIGAGSCWACSPALWSASNMTGPGGW